MTRYITSTNSTPSSSSLHKHTPPLSPLARHANKLKQRPSSWPGLSPSSHSFTSSEQEPRFSSARFVGGNTLAPFLLDGKERNDDDSGSKQPVAQRGRPVGNDNGTMDSSPPARVVPTTEWIVTSLRPVPMHYPLERGCITVDSQVPLSVIMKRISDFLRVNSISCHYNHHATRVDCQTMGLLKFAIYLWQADKRNGGTLVEVQRRQGCCIAMHHVKCGLVQAIATRASVPAMERTNSTYPTCPNDVDSNEATIVEPPSTTNSAFQICMRLLESDQHDQQRLGMESLVALTNPQTVFTKYAKQTCRALVLGEGGESLQSILLPYFQDNQRIDQENLHAVDYYDSDSDDDEGEYVQGCHYGTMHNLVLQALANALQLVASDLKQDDNTKIPLACPFWNVVCNALVYNVEVAQYRPREAALSIKCLNVLVGKLAPVLCNCPMILDRLAPVLPEANEYGKACNLLLERESHKLMGTLADGH